MKKEEYSESFWDNIDNHSLEDEMGNIYYKKEKAIFKNGAIMNKQKKDFKVRILKRVNQNTTYE